jgi:hypothetical protein
LQNDKAKIKKVIEELDEKKKETLKVMWLKVNKHESFDDSLHISADSVSLTMTQSKHAFLWINIFRPTLSMILINSEIGISPQGY